jgi:hypothetical protein
MHCRIINASGRERIAMHIDRSDSVLMNHEPDNNRV